MSYQVLARKWRPRKFSTLVGQEHVVRALTHALNEKRLHHAYLFTGTRGVGKTTIARILAKSLNCEAGVSADPCGRCSACQAIDVDRFPDYLEMDAASNRGVDDMAALLERAIYAPVQGRYKVYMIDEAHMLSGHAFNAMLKTLEEPPEHVKFILATTDPQKIPVTVLSRCLQFNLKQMPVAAIVQHLTTTLNAEGASFDVEALQEIARAAAGSMRDALSLLDQAIAHGAGAVNARETREMLGAVDTTYLLALFTALAEADGEKMLNIAEDMQTRSLSAANALQEMAVLLTRMQLLQLAPGCASDTRATDAQLATLAQNFSPAFIQLAYQIVTQGRADLPLAPDEHSGFLMTLLRLLAFEPMRVSGARETYPPAPMTTPTPKARADEPPVAPQKAEASESAYSDDAPGKRENAPPPVLSAEDAQWHALTAALKAKLGAGPAQSLAQHCTLRHLEDARCVLRLSTERQSLFSPVLQNRLEQALREHLGRNIALSIEIDDDTTQITPAQTAATQQRTRQKTAVRAIENDTFVREAMEHLDAVVDTNSIQFIPHSSQQTDTGE
ncbi:MAG: DNA polymerase III subunit gamma/tau [Zoogloeaceae bacterium]|jgi:DNA polymerase-3 subunit gamma/tau|nr:DNA polymerase III subunit gamma/tau [Zoogloeaceae bacterium]